MLVYSICKRCGAPHDDGTADFCFNCLDDLFNEVAREALAMHIIRIAIKKLIIR